ncbi:MAG: hypothetical protein QNJ37_18140 [Crocosphaera sp.]|nr:hypothetical protein [Crocosphaera sp.]
MAVEYQFTNRFNWSIIFDQTFDAVSVNPVLERYKPIPKIQLGYTIDAPIIAVFCANNEAKPNWRYGGRYFAKMLTSLNAGGTQPDTVLKVGKIYLNQIKIIQLPPFTSSYAFDVDVPYWHRNFQLKIWEYTGNNQNTIHRKLDDLLGYPQP